MVASGENSISLAATAARHPMHPVSRIAALASLVLAAVPAALTAAVVWCALGRPVLFRQVRAGLDGRPFRLVKFRTMHDRRDAAGRLLPDQDRETFLTRLIRRVRLDEIPQLFAILAGDMVFIGPRPLQPATVAGFGAAGEVRCCVRPGLTGWAQVNGNTRLTDQEKLALDVWYVDHRSLKLDAWILLLTVVTIVVGERVRRTQLDCAEAYFASRFGTGRGGRT